MTDEQMDFYFKLVQKLMYRISNKIVIHAGTFWRFMSGVMYSGGKETSHGDSWLLALKFFEYLVWIMDQHPLIEYTVDVQIMNGFIRMVIYGDDHVWCCPEFLHEYINVRSFAQFLYETCGWVLRDYQEYRDFCSVPNIENGGLLVKGPKFLKRYWIKNTINPELAPILPYKPLMEPMLKLFCDAEGLPENYTLKCLGAAWDTMGTNPLHYQLVLQFYQTLMCSELRSPMELVDLALTTQKGTFSINKLLRRVGMTKDQMFNHFPTEEELLRRHIIDTEYCKFGNKGDWEFALMEEMGIVRPVFTDKY